MTDTDLTAPEGYYWYVGTAEMDGPMLVVQLHKHGQFISSLEWTWALTPRDLAKQERIEARIRACKRALLQKYAENKRIEAAIHASR